MNFDKRNLRDTIEDIRTIEYYVGRGDVIRAIEYYAENEDGIAKEEIYDLLIYLNNNLPTK